MPKKKHRDTSIPRRKRFNQRQRLAAGRVWLASYRGKNVVRGYRRHFGVDLLCAVRELELLGVPIDPDYKAQLVKTVEQIAAARRRKREAAAAAASEWGTLFGHDEHFAFIAGFTAGGAPYGLTWEEMEAIEASEEAPDTRDAGFPDG